MLCRCARFITIDDVQLLPVLHFWLFIDSSFIVPTFVWTMAKLCLYVIVVVLFVGKWTLSAGSDTLVTSKVFMDLSIGGKPIGKLFIWRDIVYRVGSLKGVIKPVAWRAFHIGKFVSWISKESSMFPSYPPTNRPTNIRSELLSRDASELAFPTSMFPCCTNERNNKYKR